MSHALCRENLIPWFFALSLCLEFLLVHTIIQTRVQTQTLLRRLSKMLAVDFVLLLFLIIIVGFFISLPNFHSTEIKIKLHERRSRSGKEEERDDARAD